MNIFGSLTVFLMKHNKSIDDIKWIGNDNAYMSIDEFIRLSRAINDNNHFPLEFMPEKLKLVGVDFWIEKKHHDDYSCVYLDDIDDCWVYNSMPQKPAMQNNTWRDYYSTGELKVIGSYKASEGSKCISESRNNDDIINLFNYTI